MRWEDLDVEAATITIRRALVPLGGKVEVSEPKTARGRRRIALDPLTIEALKAHAARQADEQSALRGLERDAATSSPPRMASRSIRIASARPSSATCGRPPCPASRCTGCGIPTPPWPSVQGVNPRIVSATLGHSTVALTLDIYSTSCRRPTRRPPIASRP